MTVMTLSLTGASLTDDDWSFLNWERIESQVKRLQMRIAKATRDSKWGKVKALQWILTHSFYAKLLAIKRVTENKGAKIAGIDGVVWSTHQKKVDAVRQLSRRGYHPQPLRRIYIPKKNGKLRPLSIPIMLDRAQQALHLLSLEPVSETLMDRNAYGFRPGRSTADAISQCFNVLSRNYSPQWILEGDIKGCFDNIDHQWLLKHIPMDSVILQKWLECGYIDKHIFNPTLSGTPQGGIISPTLMLVTLRGLENAVEQLATRKDKVHVIAYADDFVISGATKDVLESKVKPAVESFLKERGLTLSSEKTFITHIDKGFDFLGFNIRKYHGKLLIKPAKSNVLEFIRRIRQLIKERKSVTSGELIRLLNPKLRGWGYYYRHVVSKKIFDLINHELFLVIWCWAKRRHPNKRKGWIKRKYFRTIGLRRWIFWGATINVKGEPVYQELFNISSIPIRRHIKIKSDANPYDPAFKLYFEWRGSKRNPMMYAYS